MIATTTPSAVLATLAIQPGAATPQVVPPTSSPWFELAGRLGAAWAWPLAVLILCFFFRTDIRAFLVEAAGFVSRLRRMGRGEWWADSGTVDAPAGAPDGSRLPPTSELSAQAKQVLSTLWKHQRKHFKKDLSKRWTFTIHPSAAEYEDFLVGLTDAYRAKLVTVDPESKQVYLSNKGVKYCQEHEGELTGDLLAP